ncbi:MAG: hypothetical protein DRJ35_08625 [Thermoprotei archaeon]|nr:MAG: hypothetical protein DRJ35_08625 [Thermoprotei archaeon]
MKGKWSKDEVWFFIGVLSFLATFLFLTPVLHELWHVIALMHYGQDYNLFLKAKDIEGVYAVIEFYGKELERYELLNVLMAGIVGNYLIGFVLLFISNLIYKKHPNWGIIAGMNSLAFLLDSTLYFFFDMDGDLVEVVKLFKLKDGLYLKIFGVTFLLFAITQFFWLLSRCLDSLVEKNR